MESLQDQVIAITGASAGIGRATAVELVGAGARVVLGARRKDRLDALAAEHDGRVIAVEMDVRSPDDAQELVRAGLNAFGRLDALVANAGIGMYGGILDHTDEELTTMLDTNVAGTVWPIRAAVPHFVEQGRGDIVIVASVAGFRGGADEAVYAATKFAQVGLAGALDRELRDARDPGDDDRPGRHLDRVRDGRGPLRGHARARDVPQAGGHRVRDPDRARAAAPPSDPVLDDLEHGPGHVTPADRRGPGRSSRAGPECIRRSGDARVGQAVASWGTLPCWRIRIGFPNGSRTPMSVP